jgi:hypothetical protein
MDLLWSINMDKTSLLSKKVMMSMSSSGTYGMTIYYKIIFSFMISTFFLPF